MYLRDVNEKLLFNLVYVQCPQVPADPLVVWMVEIMSLARIFNTPGKWSRMEPSKLKSWKVVCRRVAECVPLRRMMQAATVTLSMATIRLA